jgi:2-hydroxychromene-2-carboxylate isomerase
MKNNPRLFFSFRSPFSWMAVERLRRLAPDAHHRIEFIPYWEPDTRTAEALEKRGARIRYVPMSKAKHLYILHDTKRLAATLGLKMAWPVDVEPRWELSHLAWLKARSLGAGEAFYNAVVVARWGRGEDISDPEVIHSAAAAAGLDGDALVDAAEDPDIREEGVESLVEAYEDDIFGVPYMRYGPHRFWGFDRMGAFLALLQGGNEGSGLALVEDVPAELQAGVGAYDTDTAGGCG